MSIEKKITEKNQYKVFCPSLQFDGITLWGGLAQVKLQGSKDKKAKTYILTLNINPSSLETKNPSAYKHFQSLLKHQKLGDL